MFGWIVVVRSFGKLFDPAGLHMKICLNRIKTPRGRIKVLRQRRVLALHLLQAIE
jgi:hypothetical protein